MDLKAFAVEASSCPASLHDPEGLITTQEELPLLPHSKGERHAHHVVPPLRGRVNVIEVLGLKQ